MNLVRGCQGPHYSEFNNPLVLKGGHSYSDQYGRTYWTNLLLMSEDELWTLYNICKNSWGG